MRTWLVKPRFLSQHACKLHNLEFLKIFPHYILLVDELREALVEGGVAELISLLKAQFPDDAVQCIVGAGNRKCTVSARLLHRHATPHICCLCPYIRRFFILSPVSSCKPLLYRYVLCFNCLVLWCPVPFSDTYSSRWVIVSRIFAE